MLGKTIIIFSLFSITLPLVSADAPRMNVQNIPEETNSSLSKTLKYYGLESGAGSIAIMSLSLGCAQWFLPEKSLQYPLLILGAGYCAMSIVCKRKFKQEYDKHAAHLTTLYTAFNGRNRLATQFNNLRNQSTTLTQERDRLRAQLAEANNATLTIGALLLLSQQRSRMYSYELHRPVVEIILNPSGTALRITPFIHKYRMQEMPLLPLPTILPGHPHPLRYAQLSFNQPSYQEIYDHHTNTSIRRINPNFVTFTLGSAQSVSVYDPSPREI